MKGDAQTNGSLLFVFALILIGLLVWVIPGPVPADLDPARRTPQECADNYRAMSENVKAQWNNSEDYMNECVR